MVNGDHDPLFCFVEPKVDDFLSNTFRPSSVQKSSPP